MTPLPRLTGLFRRCAFTLVELLVVIGIIAVLVAILLPALQKARKASETIHCAANLKSIGQAMLLFAHNNNGRLPGEGYYGTGTMTWHRILNVEVFKGKEMIPRYGATKPDNELYCPVAAGGNLSTRRIFGMNSAMARSGNYGTLDVDNPSTTLEFLKGWYGSGLSAYNYGVKHATVREPARKWLVNENERNDYTGGTKPIYLGAGGYPKWTADKSAAGGSYSFRHPTLRMNVLFVDMHVESIAFGPTVADNLNFKPFRQN